MTRPNASQINDDQLDALWGLIEVTEEYLTAVHEAGQHDRIGPGGVCGGCHMRRELARLLATAAGADRA